MSFIKKLFLLVVILVLLGGIFYFIFNRPEKSEAQKNPFFDLFSRGRQTVEEKVSSGSKKLIDTGVESVKEEIQKKGSGILTFLKEEAAEAIDSAQKKVGLEKSSDRESQTAAMSSGGSIKVLPVAKAGVKSYFLISNPNPSEEVEYEIDWGDGSSEKGVLSGENKTIFHSWNREGEFLVNFKILGSSSVSESIKVLVIK